MARQPNVDIQLRGIEQSKRNLLTLSTKIQKSIVRAAIRQMANVFLRQTRTTTYGAGRQQRTGLLLRSQSVSTNAKAGEVTAKIRMRDVNVSGSTPIARRVRAGRSFAKAKPPLAMRAFYWSFLEFGTKQRATNKGANRGVVTPRAWVVPAFDAKAFEAIDAFTKRFADGVEQACRELPKGV